MTDLPGAFKLCPLGDPNTKPDWAKPFNPDYISGYNACLEAIDAANLLRERNALAAHLHDLLTGPNLGLSEATADRMIADTLKEARGEP